MKLHQKETVIKIKPDDIAFDIDGVVADTMSSFIYVAWKWYGIDGIRKEQITSYWLEDCLPIPEETIKAIINRILEDPFDTKLSPIEGAVDTLTRIAEHGPVHFVTARPVKAPIEKWLRQVLDDVPPDMIRVHATGRHALKPQVLQSIGRTFFMEDHLETCQAICQAGLRPIVFDQPWNQGTEPFARVRSWAELNRFMEMEI